MRAAPPSAHWPVLVRIRRARAGLRQGVHSRPRCDTIAFAFPLRMPCKSVLFYMECGGETSWQRRWKNSNGA